MPGRKFPPAAQRAVNATSTHIPAVAPDIPRPLWSVMVPTHNCSEYLRATLQSVLAQDPGADQMQIEVVDDCSADEPEAVVRDLGGGRVGFHRQPHNVGHVCNFNTCIARARGRLVHILHGDDCVLPGFYRTLAQPLTAHADLGAAFCRHIFMDEAGHWQVIGPLLAPQSGRLDRWLETIAVGQRTQPPSMVVRRSVYERLGGFDPRIRSYGEDWEMWVRIAAHYPVWYEVAPLAAYRIRHSGSLSGLSARTGQNMRDLRRAVEINAEHLPAPLRRTLSRRARLNNALGALRRAHRQIAFGDFRTPLVQLREAILTSADPRVAVRSLGLLGHWTAALARRTVGRRHRQAAGAGDASARR